jgi:hypothetical protein
MGWTPRRAQGGGDHYLNGAEIDEQFEPGRFQHYLHSQHRRGDWLVCRIVVAKGLEIHWR